MKQTPKFRDCSMSGYVAAETSLPTGFISMRSGAMVLNFEATAPKNRQGKVLNRSIYHNAIA